jgi:hypothetical protein
MASKKYKPTITKQRFDAIATELRAALKRKYDASKSDADRPPSNPATKGAFDHLPDLDSKTVARWSGEVKTYLGCKLDPSLIRRGGYESFDDCWADLKAKIRATCPDGQPRHATTRVEVQR